MSPFNKLTPAEAERLAMLIEECGEVIQAATKILRHGYESYNPDLAFSPTNRQHLIKEICDLRAIECLMIAGGEIQQSTPEAIANASIRKLKYSHHQGADQ